MDASQKQNDEFVELEISEDGHVTNSGHDSSWPGDERARSYDSTEASSTLESQASDDLPPPYNQCVANGEFGSRHASEKWVPPAAPHAREQVPAKLSIAAVASRTFPHAQRPLLRLQGAA